MLKRKIDSFLTEWKNSKNHKPLIISGARQVGKTTSIKEFGKSYKCFIEINFKLNPSLKNIFKNSFECKDVIKEISLNFPENEIIENDTLILFDEIQDYPDAVTSLKSFAIDGRFDVICSGSLLGISYKQINSIPVGFKEDYLMHSMDFEEFLWALGYTSKQIDDIYEKLKELEPLSTNEFEVLSKAFNDYLFVGGMPEATSEFIQNRNFGSVFKIHSRIYKDYEDDITKYVEGLSAAKVKNMYRHIGSQLAKDNHKYQISKLGHGARARDYVGCEEWLKDAGIINIGYCLNNLSIPLSNELDFNNYRIYYEDHSLFIASLDEESKRDLIMNGNYDIYSGSLYESIVSESLISQGYKLYFYKNNDATVELDFVIRSKNEIVPIEVKRNRGRSKSLRAVINDKDINIKKGIKLANQNIGFDGDILTIPYFLSFLIKRFLEESNITSW